jgi:hypothetical protein
MLDNAKKHGAQENNLYTYLNELTVFQVANSFFFFFFFSFLISKF